MNFIEFLGITVAPSLTLGLVIFFAKNWFLERLKNSIKHEYDKSLEKFKGDLKHDNDKSLEKFKGELKANNDKELEEIKAILKKQTDVSLEDYRFQIEIRKKWLDDLKDLSSKYIEKVKENMDITNKYIVNNNLLKDKKEDQLNHYKETLYNIGQLFTELKTIRFKIELLIIDCDQYGEEIYDSMHFIENWIYTELDDHFEKKILLDLQSDKVLRLKEHNEAFKINVKNLLRVKVEKL